MFGIKERMLKESICRMESNHCQRFYNKNTMGLPIKQSEGLKGSIFNPTR